MALPELRSSVAHRLTQPAVALLVKTGIAPDVITWLGFLLAVAAAVLVTIKYLWVAGILVIMTGFFDILDGALARHTNRVTRFGAVLDSTLDRLSEAVLLLGILVLYAREQSFIGILLVGVVLFSSLVVSYIRARAEGMGLECRVGLFTRGERVIVLVLGLLLGQIEYVLIIALATIAILSLFTVAQRLIYVWQQTKTG
ncbi:CDP-alcohol phosphatidyltransferase family protein [Chloroflexota bacterium]